MSRHLRLLTLFATGFGAMIAHNQSIAEAKPNLVVFLSDDHGYLDSSAAGDARYRTPSMARLAKQGMTFTQAFAASPSCAPSRAALLTGLMPARNGSMLNHQPPRPEVKKLPAYLHELGYEVVAFGKVAHYKQGKDYGFDLIEHDTFHDAECIPAALKYLRKWSGKKPLCLFVGTNWPHVPWPEVNESFEGPLPPTHVDTLETRQWRAQYAAAVERCDVDLGKIYDAAYKHLGPNTLFVHFSDHGAQWPFGKWNLYDAGTRVPFVAVWPNVISPGSRSDAMVSLVDVLPTLIEVAGGTPPADIDGHSFCDVLIGEKTAHRDRIFTTHSGDGRMNAYPMRSVRTPRWKYIRNLRPEGKHHTHIDLGTPVDGKGYWQSWIERTKTDPDAAEVVERYHRRPAEELYDLESDPHEQSNLVGDASYTQVVAELRTELDEWMREQGDEGIITETDVAAAFQVP
ncbi:MAG: sulfatase [Pirellulales bacterium]